jgi:hypothetical protein
MKEIILQEPFELKFGNKVSTIVNGKKVFKTEEFVKINEKGECASLNLTIPAEIAKKQKIKIKITSEGAQIVEQSGINKCTTSTMGTKTKETPNLYEITWAKATQNGRIRVWAATPVDAYKLARFDKFPDRAYQGIREIE